MVNVNVTPIDAGLVGVTVAVTQYLKQYVPKPWIPVIPVLVALVLTAPAVLINEGGWPGTILFLSRWVIESFKIFALAISSYDLATKTGKIQRQKKA